MYKNKLFLLAEHLSKAEFLVKKCSGDVDRMVLELSELGLDKRYLNFAIHREISESIVKACCPTAANAFPEERADELLNENICLFYAECEEKWMLYPIVEGFLNYPKHSYSDQELSKGRKILIRKLIADDLDINDLGIRFKSEFPDFYGSEYEILSSSLDLTVAELLQNFLNLNKAQKNLLVLYLFAVIGYHGLIPNHPSIFSIELLLSELPFSLFFPFFTFLLWLSLTFLPIVGLLILLSGSIWDSKIMNYLRKRD